MAHLSAKLSSNSAPSSVSRNCSCYIEIREYRFSKDELRKKDHTAQTSSPYPTSKSSFARLDHAYPLRSFECPKNSYGRARANWKVSGLYKRSSEYEDIYNKRPHSERSAGAVTSGMYGGHSWSEERITRGHGRITDEVSDTNCAAVTSLIRDMVRTNGTRNTEGRSTEREMEDSRCARDTRDTTDVMYTNEPKDGRGIKDTRNYRYIHYERGVRDNRLPEKQRNVKNIKDTGSRINTRDIGENGDSRDIGEIRSLGRKLVLQGTRQDSLGRHLSSRASRRNVNMGRTDLDVDTRLSQRREKLSLNFAPSQGSRKSSGPKLPPPVLPKPDRSKPQTARPDSPARSESAHSSGASSNGLQNKAVNEKGVKSILKKPCAGRVVFKEEPSSFITLAVLSCILCFPFGIYALIKSNQVKTAVEENDYELALSASRKTKRFCLGVTIAYIGIFFIGAALIAKYFITGKLI